jgi:hypothetical protein
MRTMLWVAPVMLLAAIAGAAWATRKFVRTEIGKAGSKRQWIEGICPPVSARSIVRP